jgi:hypothetical protein
MRKKNGWSSGEAYRKVVAWRVSSLVRPEKVVLIRFSIMANGNWGIEP